MTNSRTIEEILEIRKRATELRVQQRAVAILEAHAAIEHAKNFFRDPAPHEAALTKAFKAKRLADDALGLVNREIDAYRRQLPKTDGDFVPYDPVSTFMEHRYAAVLMFDNPNLTADEALSQARADERVRFEEYSERAHAGDVIDDI